MKKPFQSSTTVAKALAVNQYPRSYGVFAEIGAGQEVARFFFQAGQASQTIAKTMSAYDMIYSDEIYGREPSGRYVCENRLKHMLDKEFSLLQRRLQKSRGATSEFFAFANTVATGDQKKRFTHGWLGVRFQARPDGPTNDIIMHVRLLDKYRLQQQEILGVLGVNLVYAAYFLLGQPENMVSCLVDQIKPGQVSVDLIRFEGPDCGNINSHLVNLEMVKRGICEATFFDPKEEILSISDEFFSRPLIIQRGAFYPITATHLQVMSLAQKQFAADFSMLPAAAAIPPEAPLDNSSISSSISSSMKAPDKCPETDSGKPAEQRPLSIYEMAIIKSDGKTIPKNSVEREYLHRIQSVASTDSYSLVTGFFLHYELKRFLRQYTQAPIVILIGAAHLERIFEEVHYQNLEGGLIEALGKFLDPKTKMYVYPHRRNGELITVKSFQPPKKYRHIFDHFIEMGQIVDLVGGDQIPEFIHSDQIRKWIDCGDERWEAAVPPQVKAKILQDMK